MEIYFAFALLLFCNAVGAAEAEQECSEREEYTECGAGCQATCPNVTWDCRTGCVAGCICKDDFLRNAEGQCVKPEQCSANCGENEVYTECLAACQHTCKNPQPKICTAICQQGCLCKEGYLRNTNGKCIKEEHCPPNSCPPNEEPSACVVPCGDCVIKRKCQFFACNPGCDCITGYYRDKDGHCIPEDQCPSGSGAAAGRGRRRDSNRSAGAAAAAAAAAATQAAPRAGRLKSVDWLDLSTK